VLHGSTCSSEGWAPANRRPTLVATLVPATTARFTCLTARCAGSRRRPRP
jgi:hypothetical protein